MIQHHRVLSCGKRLSWPEPLLPHSRLELVLVVAFPASLVPNLDHFTWNVTRVPLERPAHRIPLGLSPPRPLLLEQTHLLALAGSTNAMRDGLVADWWPEAEMLSAPRASSGHEIALTA
jgi:hypothetical protein